MWRFWWPISTWRFLTHQKRSPTWEHPWRCHDLLQKFLSFVLTDQPNLVINCEIIPSLHTNGQHQINQVTLHIRSPPPPPFRRRIWHYDRAQVEAIKRAISNYDWITELDLGNTDPDLQVEHLTEVLNNILTNWYCSCKKESKQLMKNYKPISLLPVFGRMFENILFNYL